MKERPTEFTPIENEILRQYDQEFRISESHDSKIGIILGFILISIGLSSGSISAPQVGAIHANLVLNVVGLSLLLLASILGLKAFFIRKYTGGPNIEELIALFREEGLDRDFDMVIAKRLNDSILINKEINQKRVEWIKAMFFTFALAIISIVFSRLLYLGGI